MRIACHAYTPIGLLTALYENGVIRRLHGKTGDDFVALNAWDWCTSAVGFGAIRHMLVQDINAEHDEMRLLPGRKTYASGEQTECEISDCVFSRISGIYNVKMYQQPNCHNFERGMNDRSEIAGVIRNVVFSEFYLERAEITGIADVHVEALFEICADCENIRFDGVSIAQTETEFLNGGMHLTDVGPKSSTWTRGCKNTDEWCELFDPDLNCIARNMAFRHIRFAGKECRSIDTLAHAHRLSPNPDYPRTRPRGGTGYGAIENAAILAD
jgi:hypothetical protein